MLLTKPWKIAFIYILFIICSFALALPNYRKNTPEYRQKNKYIHVSIGQKTFKLPAGSKIRIIQEREKSAETMGQSVRTTSTDIAQNISGQSPSLTLGEIATGEGNFSFDGELNAEVQKSQGFFYILGGITFLVGLGFSIFVPGGRIKGVMIMVGGLVLASVGFVMATYPWVVLLAVVVVVAGAVWFVWDGRENGKVQDAAKKIVRGIEKAPQTISAYAKESIKHEDTDGNVRDIVNKVKKKEKL